MVRPNMIVLALSLFMTPSTTVGPVVPPLPTSAATVRSAPAPATSMPANAPTNAVTLASGPPKTSPENALEPIRSRYVLAGMGILQATAAAAMIRAMGDRNGGGDPGALLAGTAVIALTGSVLGAVMSVVSGDDTEVTERVTPATVALGIAGLGSNTTGEAEPLGFTGRIAPTWMFPHQLGQIRVLGNFTTDLGLQVQRDPRPQFQPENQPFQRALVQSSWSLDAGADIAVRLRASFPRERWLGAWELRYKPQFFFAHTQRSLGAEANTQRVTERIALTPLTFGVRYEASARQRFTIYLGPRWDAIGHGTASDVELGQPFLAPVYGEAWFDMDIPLRSSAKLDAVSQFTLGYVHSRFYGNGLNIGAMVGFLGPMFIQYSVRVRPKKSAMAYQFDLGLRVGDQVDPYAQIGIVLPGVGKGG